ncbi:MAG: YIP1 family protein [Pseudomonadota bacterium]
MSDHSLHESDLPDVHLSDVVQELEPLSGMSLWARMRLSYADMRHTTRALIEERPSEARLLFFVLFSDLIFFLARGVQLVVSPSSAAQQSLPLEIGLWLIAVLLIRTLTLYIFSALVCVGGWAFGGTASWQATRTAVFWASLVAAPVGVFGALIGAGFAHLEPLYPIFAEPLLAWPPLLIGVVAFVYFLSAGVAEAHRFERTSNVFITFSVMTVVLLVTGLWLFARYGQALVEAMRQI